jgi:RimJ/RimL family protein N-acetyltransferase
VRTPETVLNPIMLRPFRRMDITDEYIEYFKDPEFTRYLEAKNITKKQAITHMETHGGIFMAIVDLMGRHVGNIKLSKERDLSTIIFPPYQGKGYATRAIRVMLKLIPPGPVTAGILHGNSASLSAYTKAGFTITSRDAGKTCLRIIAT